MKRVWCSPHLHSLQKCNFSFAPVWRVWQTEPGMGEVKWWHFTKPFLVAAEMHRIRMALNTSDWWQQCLTSQGLSGKVFLLVGNSPGQPIFKMCVKLQLHQVLDHGHRALWPLALALWLHSNPPTHTCTQKRQFLTQEWGRKELHKKTGQTVLFRCRAWPDKRTDGQTTYAQTAFFIHLSLYFLKLGCVPNYIDLPLPCLHFLP